MYINMELLETLQLSKEEVYHIGGVIMIKQFSLKKSLDLSSYIYVLVQLKYTLNGNLLCHFKRYATHYR